MHDKVIDVILIRNSHSGLNLKTIKINKYYNMDNDLIVLNHLLEEENITIIMIVSIIVFKLELWFLISKINN